VSFCYSAVTASLQVSFIEDSEDITITVYLAVVLDVVHRLCAFIKTRPFENRGSFVVTWKWSWRIIILMGPWERSRHHYQWLRRLVAGFSLRRRGLGHNPVHMGFVVDEVALGQALLRIFWFFLVSIIPQAHTNICCRRCVILANER